MAKEKKRFKVDFKPVNVKLKATRKQLKKIERKVTSKDQKAIAAQIRAIDVLLAACAASSIGPIVPPMSHLYTAK
jgi:hypothetical protein